MEKIEPSDFIVKSNSCVDLNTIATQYQGEHLNKEKSNELKYDVIQEMRALQEMFYAHNKHALLIVFQAMDAAGKDSTIKHVMTGINPQGCSVHSFKKPSEEELDHDFLWRCNKVLPARGMIGIFNRSYYEETLVVRVHPQIVLNQQLPGVTNLKEVDQEFWNSRFDQINSMEKHLKENGTEIIKFYLHVSKNEQAKRFLKRIDRKDKNWKFNIGDMKERECWDQYRMAYEDCITHTSTDQAPWYIIPADDKWYMRLVVSEIIKSHMKGLKMSFPEPDKESLLGMTEAKNQLLKELENN